MPLAFCPCVLTNRQLTTSHGHDDKLLLRSLLRNACKLRPDHGVRRQVAHRRLQFAAENRAVGAGTRTGREDCVFDAVELREIEHSAYTATPATPAFETEVRGIDESAK